MMLSDQRVTTEKRDIAMLSLWLFTDARTDHSLEEDIAALPNGAGVIFRHYHLPLATRKMLFIWLKQKFARAGLLFIWSGDANDARQLGADGIYGSPKTLRQNISIGPAMLRLAAVHNMAEIAAANRLAADLAFLSPVFPTRSHCDANVLGVIRFAILARHVAMPVCALGGVTHSNYQRIAPFSHGWGAIDGLSQG